MTEIAAWFSAVMSILNLFLVWRALVETTRLFVQEGQDYRELRERIRELETRL